MRRRTKSGPYRRNRAAFSNNVGPAIQSLHSYVSADKIYCGYIATSEEKVREHARQGGFPANRVSEIGLIIDPTSAEARFQQFEVQAG